MSSYDSTEDTNAHINRVQDLIEIFCQRMDKRALVHDASKLESPEKEGFDNFTPRLKNSTYGSEEYKGFLVQMGEVLKHHYQNNSHHPEFWSERDSLLSSEISSSRESLIRDFGVPTSHPAMQHLRDMEDESRSRVSQMSLLDVVEMLLDWQAATERHADGNIFKSLEINKSRFHISDQLAQILFNTMLRDFPEQSKRNNE